MNFSDVIGQEPIKQRLIQQAKENRVPHALMFCGQSGRGKLALAIAFAHYLLCENAEEDSCGECRTCKMFDTFNHPDVHFVFPVVKKGDNNKKVVSDDYLEQWRAMLADGPYFGLNHWLSKMGAEKKQALIYEAESDSLQHKAMLKSSMGGYKVFIVWLPEKMNAVCANKLLKLFEEPPAQTVFLLVCERKELLLEPIVSRTQIIEVPPVAEDAICKALQERCSIGAEDARFVAHSSGGSYLNALETVHVDADSQLYFDMFVLLMRLAYMRKLKELKSWSERLSEMSGDAQKNFLDYCQRMVRENFVYNFQSPEINYETLDERDFSKNFARFINERNVIGIMEELELAQRDIMQNVNPKIVFFDFAMKIIRLLIL